MSKADTQLPHASMRSAIAAIWDRSRDTALARVAVLEDAVAALLDGRLSDELRRQAERDAHRLAGSAGTFGFAVASALARELELMLSGTEPIARDRLALAADQVAALRADLERPTPCDEEPQPALPAAEEPPTRQLLVAVGEHGPREEIIAAAAARGLHAAVVTGSDNAPAATAGTVAAIVDLGLGDAAFRLIAQLASLHGPVPTLALTASDAFTDRVQAARAGARSFLSADVSPDELLDAVEGLLERSSTADTTVLVVDDDATVLEMVDSVLTAAGLRMVGIDDPRQFWAALEQHAPDLVVVDLDMPQITGEELCRVVRSDPHWAGLPLLCLTAHRDADTVNAIFSAGADDFVAKPLVGPELLARISNRLERTRLFKAFADTDPLTGVANRRRAEPDLQLLLGLAKRHRQPLSIAMLDLDRFKQVNDGHGHAVGDMVLRRLSSLLAGAFRGDDVVARWGGEEFLVGMYGMTRDDGVQRLACILEELREECFPTPSGGEISVSFSAGVATYPGDASTVHGLWEAADDALYRAKRGGRDRVLPASPSAPDKDADVVVVNHDETLVELLGRALTTRGLRYRRLPDGRAAAAQLAGSPPKLRARVVVLDSDAPGMDGMEVLRRMAAAGVLADTHVIMLTDRPGEEGVETLARGAVEHVARPCNVPMLMERIRCALPNA